MIFYAFSVRHDASFCLRDNTVDWLMNITVLANEEASFVIEN